MRRREERQGSYEGARGKTAYQEMLSLLTKCQGEFRVRESSKIWWGTELDGQAKEVRRFG